MSPLAGEAVNKALLGETTLCQPAKAIYPFGARAEKEYHGYWPHA